MQKNIPPTPIPDGLHRLLKWELHGLLDDQVLDPLSKQLWRRIYRQIDIWPFMQMVNQTEEVMLEQQEDA